MLQRDFLLPYKAYRGPDFAPGAHAVAFSEVIEIELGADSKRQKIRPGNLNKNS
jgi:hypothetical protein